MTNISKKIILYIILTLLAAISAGPFLWLLSTALKPPVVNIFEYPPQLIPKNITFENFIGVWKQIPFALYIINSFIAAFFIVLLNLILSSLAAYPLARMNFKGKNITFFAVLATIMIPFQVIMVPVYLMVLRLNLVDSYSNIAGYAGLILPFAVSAFGIFFMRQAFLAIPKELEEAAIIDGCSIFDIWLKIFLPLCKPALATLAIFTFAGAWSEFLWPSIVLSRQDMYTLPVGLNHLQGVFSSNWRYIAAGAVISMTPILVFFISLQKYFTGKTLEGSVKE